MISFFHGIMDGFIFWFLLFLLTIMLPYTVCKENEALHKKYPKYITRKNSGHFISNFLFMVISIYYLIFITESIGYTLGYMDHVVDLLGLDFIFKNLFSGFFLFIFLLIICSILNFIFWMFIGRQLIKIFFPSRFNKL
jgi:hypothetical protein